MGVDKSSIQFNEILITVGEQTCTDVRNQDEIERVGFADFNQFLKACQVTSVVVEILSKFIPNEDDGFQIVDFDSLLDPVSEVAGRHSKRLDLTLSGHLENLLHERMKRRIRITSQFADDIIYRVATEKVRVTALNINTEALFIFRV